MRCRICGEDAIYRDERLCSTHFKRYFEKKIKKVVDNPLLSDKSVLVAMSGGKDSSALLFALSRLISKKIIKNSFRRVEALFIHLGIKDSSDYNLKIVKQVCEVAGIKLNELELKKNYSFSIDDIAKKSLKVCSMCGAIKRYILNRYAYENHFDFVLTGHNLDDEMFFALNNIIHGNLDYLIRSGKLTLTDRAKKMIGRVKPLYYLTEKETAIYCLLNKIPFSRKDCPYASETTQYKMKTKIPELFPSRDLKKSFIKNINKLKKFYPKDQGKEQTLSFCNICGFPTSQKTCKFCRIKQNFS